MSDHDRPWAWNGSRWLFRPAFELIGLITAATVTGTLLLGLEGGSGLLWIERGARAAVPLHVHPRLNSLMTDITSFGAEIFLLLAFIALAVWSYHNRGVSWARFFVLVMAGALSIDNLVKPLVGRQRPPFDQLVVGRGESFPSGHTTATTALLLALAYYLASGRNPKARAGIWTAALSGSILMGVSRVYLGVHWPTDVIAGIALGAAWTLLCARSQGISIASAVPSPAPARWTPRRRMVAWAIALALVGVACTESSSSSDRSGLSESQPSSSPSATEDTAPTYEVDIDPANFVDRIDNPYFPLEPGTVFHLKGATEDGVERETITVTDRTKTVMGVTTTVVKDVARVDGGVAEFTFDWYAQDQDGNVWYFGEDTAELEDREVVNRKGSWEAGVDGALPGIIMNADPQVTDSYRQEYYEGEAEDLYWVVATGESKSVAFGDFDDVIRTLEWNPLEPRVVGEKFYAPGVGLIWERALSGGKEIVELIDVTTP